MSYLKITNLVKIYDIKKGIKAVNNVNLDISKGEIISCLGSSGCGKTSTLRMIAGLESISNGDIYLDGIRLNDIAPSQRNVAVAFENYSLYPPLNIRDNILFGAKHQYKNDSTNLEKNFKEIVDITEINHILDKKPSFLSSGEQQRVSLARALLRKAKLYALDEPFSQLENKLRQRMCRKLKKYLKDTNKTVILITHDQSEALSMADRIVIMQKGILHQIGTQAQIMNTPKTLFVASFVGEPPMNIIDVKHKDILNVNTKPQVAFIGIRPVDIRIEHIKQTNKDDANAHVTLAQWIGNQTHIGLQINGITLNAAQTDIYFETKENQKVKIHLYTKWWR